MVHFNDKSRSLRVTTAEDGKYQITTPMGNKTSTSVNALIKDHVASRTSNITEEKRSVSTGDEVIISSGEHKGKHGFVSLSQGGTGDKKYHIKKNDSEGYGHFSEDQFFHKHLTEEMNGVGGGAIAGAGVGPAGEPGVRSDRSNVADIVLSAIRRRKINSEPKKI